MEYIFEIKDEQILKKSFTTSLDTITLEKLETAKKYLKKSNPKITKQDIVNIALNDYFEKLKIEKCELEEIIPLKIKRTSYEVIR